MNPGRWFALAMIVLSIGAALGYLYIGDFRRMTYWTAAAVLNATVTW
jgi:hypothetical protein